MALKGSGMRIRCGYKPYIEAVDRFSMRSFKASSYLSTNGGPIIAMQVENEYGSFEMLRVPRIPKESMEDRE